MKPRSGGKNRVSSSRLTFGLTFVSPLNDCDEASSAFRDQSPGTQRYSHPGHAGPGEIPLAEILGNQVSSNQRENHETFFRLPFVLVKSQISNQEAPGLVLLALEDGGFFEAFNCVWSPL